MGEELLVNERIEAGADFVRAINDHIPVSVACWIVRANSDTPYLYIASDAVDGRNIRDAYGDVIRTFQRIQNAWLDPFQVKLINSEDPIAKEAIKVRDRYAIPIATRYGGTSIGGTGIDGAYIYPPVYALPVAT